METEPANVKIETVIPSKPIDAPPSRWWTIRVYDHCGDEWNCFAYPTLDRAKMMHTYHLKLGKPIDPIIHVVTMPEQSKAFTNRPEPSNGN